jgi:cobalt-precorrin-7 (C5)-methyltransferase
MNKVYIIGVGPGSLDYLLPIAKKEIERCDLLIGAKRLLLLFNHLKKENIILEGNLDKIISNLNTIRKKKRVALLVSGDPGLFSLLGKISKVLNREEYIVIPGISSISVACAKIGEMWQDFKIISIHGRKIDNLATLVKDNPKIALFTDQKFTPTKIAKELLSKGIENRKVIVFENLTYPEERIVEVDLENLSRMREFKLCLMFIMK